MKANEFVKKYGLVKSTGIVGLMTAGVINYDGDSVDYNDLKRIVESYELVEYYGGLSQSRRWIERTVFKLSDSMIALKKAIADVESCQ